MRLTRTSVRSYDMRGKCDWDDGRSTGRRYVWSIRIVAARSRRAHALLAVYTTRYPYLAPVLSQLPGAVSSGLT